MKQYLIDGLSRPDHKKLKVHLDKHLDASPVEGVYWLFLEKNLLTPEQDAHKECHPHLLAVILESGSLSCEFLVRIKQNIKCDCMGYVTPEQRSWAIDWADETLERLNIRI